jgi:hypothetical protein
VFLAAVIRVWIGPWSHGPTGLEPVLTGKGTRHAPEKRMLGLADVLLLMIVIYELERIRRAVGRARYLVIKDRSAEPYGGD